MVLSLVLVLVIFFSAFISENSNVKGRIVMRHAVFKRVVTPVVTMDVIRPCRDCLPEGGESLLPVTSFGVVLPENRGVTPACRRATD